MIGELRGAAILKGARGQPPCDLDALAAALSRLSLFAAAKRAEFTSIDINPLLVRAEGRGRGGARRADPDRGRGCRCLGELFGAARSAP